MTVNPYRNLTSVGYLFQAPELTVLQAKTELMFKATDTLADIEKGALDKTTEMISTALAPEIREGLEMPEKPETITGPQGARITVDNPIAVAKRLVKAELDRIKGKISQDIEAVKANLDLIANIPKATAWNITTAFLFGKSLEEPFMAAVTEVNITEPPALSLPESSLLNSAQVQHKSIAEARDSLEAEKKQRQQDVNTGAQALINRIPDILIAVELKIINTGITLSFPEYQDMIAKLAGVVVVTAPRITEGFTPLIISGGLLALFALISLSLGQKQQ
jgi:hypothetical protein